MHHITPHYTAFHSLPLYSATFQHVLLRSVPSGKAAFASNSLQNPLLHYITTDSPAFHNIALRPTTLHRILSRSVLQKKAALFSQRIRNRLLVTLHPIALHSTTLHFILQHSKTFFCFTFDKEGSIHFQPIKDCLLCHMKCHSSPFSKILLHPTTFHHV